MDRRILLGVAGWLSIAAIATAGTVMAIGVLEDGITGSSVRPLDHDAVQGALSRSSAEPRSPSTGQATSPATAPSPSASPPRGGGAVTRVFAAGGDSGTVTARCAGGRVTLVSWSPGQGYRADDLERGPAKAAALSFTSDEEEFRVSVSCGPDGPIAQTSQDDGHHGRGRGGHG
jgi:hypothetical protein